MCSHTRLLRTADGVWKCKRCGEPKEPPDRFHEIAESGKAPEFGFARRGRMDRKREIHTEAEAHEMADEPQKKFEQTLEDAKTQRGKRLKDAYYERHIKPPVGQDIQLS